MNVAWTKYCGQKHPNKSSVSLYPFFYFSFDIVRPHYSVDFYLFCSCCKTKMGKKKNQNKTKKNENKNSLPSAPPPPPQQEPPAQPRDRSPSPIHEPIEVVDTASVLLQHASFNKRSPSHPNNNSNSSYNNASTSGLTSSPQQQKSATPTVSPGNVTRYKSFSGELSSNVRQLQQQQH